MLFVVYYCDIYLPFKALLFVIALIHFVYIIGYWCNAEKYYTKNDPNNPKLIFLLLEKEVIKCGNAETIPNECINY